MSASSEQRNPEAVSDTPLRIYEPLLPNVLAGESDSMKINCERCTEHGSADLLMQAADRIWALQRDLAASQARVELGCAGHFICAKDCHWRRHTQVGDYRVSSVGDLYYSSEPDKRQTIGATGYFETLVFRLTDKPAADNEGCGCREVAEWREIDGRRYDTAGEAQAGHEEFVRKYAALAEDTK